MDLTAYEANLRRVSPGIEILRLSTRSDEGMAGWVSWPKARLAEKSA